MPKITDPAKLKELQDKRLKLHTDMTALLDGKKALSKEEDEKWAKMETDYDTVYNELEDHQKCVDADLQLADAHNKRLEKLAAMGKHGSRFSDRQERLILAGGGDDDGEGENHHVAKDGPLKGLTDAQIGAVAFSAWCRGVESPRDEAACKHLAFNPHRQQVTMNLLPTECINAAQALYNDERRPKPRNTLTSGIGASGGFTFGESFVTTLEEAMLTYGGIMQTAEIMRTDTGEPMRWPTVNDTANKGRQIGESQAVASLDPNFGQVIWTAHKFTSDEILVPSELLGNNAVGLANKIPEMLGTRLARILNEKGTTGNDANTMQGMVTSSAFGVTAASATAITFDEVIDLEFALGSAYLPGATYMMGRNMLKLLRKLVDGEDRYLWQSGANSGAPDTLNTYRYVINEDMADPAASQKSMIFGQLNKWKLRMVRQVRFFRLMERHRENDQDAFLAFVEADGRLLDAGTHPIVHLIQHS